MEEYEAYQEKKKAMRWRETAHGDSISTGANLFLESALDADWRCHVFGAAVSPNFPACLFFFYRFPLIAKIRVIALFFFFL